VETNFHVMEKRILILGGNGYVGCRLYEHFLSKGYFVENVDICWFDRIYEETIKCNYDDLDPEYIRSFSHVILLAGHSSVSMCQNLSACFENNVSNYIRLIEKLHDKQVLLFASTAAVYGSNSAFVDESFPLSEAINFYDYTMLCKESAMKLYPNKNIVAMRFGSVGGFSKNFRKENLMNSISLSAHNEGKIVISNPDRYRSVLGITDLCRAIETLVERGSKRRIYNLTSLNAKILDFGKTLQQITGCDLEINDTFKTEYSFNCSSDLFQKDYGFSFNDTIESMYLEISQNSNNILVNEKREKRDTI
jgi:nucleoside-diphosphate-sugar epimerase